MPKPKFKSRLAWATVYPNGRIDEVYLNGPIKRLKAAYSDFEAIRIQRVRIVAGEGKK